MISDIKLKPKQLSTMVHAFIQQRNSKKGNLANFAIIRKAISLCSFPVKHDLHQVPSQK